MKNDCYELKCLKQMLRQKREDGVKVLEWKLTAKRKEYIENLGYIVEPYLYSINTKTFCNIRHIHSTLLKDLHYAKKRGKNKYGEIIKKR